MLNVTQTGTSVNGTASIAGHPETFSLVGTHTYPNVNMQGTAFGLAVTFSGTFDGSNSIAGTLSTAGFPSQAVTLNRL
jgi:hypothetical protein